MIRYFGEPYEGSDDQANDIIRGNQRLAEEAAKKAKALKATAKKEASDLPKLRKLAEQYRNDMLYPPDANQRKRRIAAINAVIGEAE